MNIKTLETELSQINQAVKRMASLYTCSIINVMMARKDLTSAQKESLLKEIGDEFQKNIIDDAKHMRMEALSKSFPTSKGVRS